MEIENLKTATLRKLYDAGYKTPLQIITITKEQLLELDGVKEKSANKLYNNIQKGYQSASLAQIVVACNLLGGGLGVKTVDSILAEIPDIFEQTNDVSQQLISITGIQQKTVNKIVPKLQSARVYLATLPPRTPAKVKLVNTIDNTAIKNKKIIFSGFRNKELKDRIVNQGGIIQSSLNKSTDILVVRDKEVITTKIN